MNKAERIKAIENELAQLRAELEQESKENWRAENGGYYWYVDDRGLLINCTEQYDSIDELRHKAGNYFRTEEEAKNSLYYFMLNSEFFYWFPDMPKPKELPRGVEFYFNSCWQEDKVNPVDWSGYVRRYPKHYKGGDK